MLLRYRALAMFVFAFLLTIPLQAQVETGKPPMGSFGGGPEVIDLGNLNTHWTFPILNKPGRGGADFNFYLTYESSTWTPVTYNGATSWTAASNWGWSVSDVGLGTVVNTIVSATSNICNQQFFGLTWTFTWAYVDAIGTVHPFPGTSQYSSPASGPCGSYPNNGFTATALDGSGYTITVYANSLTSLYGSSGQLVTVPLNSELTGTTGSTSNLQDRNGNIISTDGKGNYYDTLSGTTPVLIQAGSGTPSSPYTFSYTPPAGSPNAVYSMKYTTYSVQTNFGCSGVTDFGTNGTTTANLVSEIDLPDGTKYLFTYEPTPGKSGFVTGRLASLTLPTGGTLSYTYQGGNNGIFCADGSTAGFKRYTPDTGSSAYWNYSRTIGTGAASTTTITDPSSQANNTVIQFQGFYETERQSYQGAISTSNLLRTIYSCYNAASYPCNSTSITQPVTQRTVTSVLPGAANLTSQHIYKYNSGGSLTEQDDYDYGHGTVGSLLKKTAITYASLTHIAAFRSQVTVTNGSGAVVSQTKWNYGDTVTATSGTPQHTTPSGSRGNILSVNYYTQGSTFLTKSFTYFDTGSVQTASDVNNAQTTYAYGACGNSFPTSVTEPLSLSRSMAWNCTGGVVTSVTDENNQSASMSYSDSYFWRPAAVTDPTNAAATVTYTGQTQVEGVLPIATGSSASDGLGILDSLGRKSLSQTRQTPNGSTFDTVETDYDINGRPVRVTLPFTASSGQKSSTAPGTTTVYDAIGRVTSTTDSGNGTLTNSYSQNDVFVTRGPAPTGENTKKRQLEYDALGRLTSVCEITSAGGSGTCSQTNSQTGFWTKYTYDPLGHLTGATQNAQASGSTQSRSFSYDLLGRVTSETHAESGTTTYTFDTDSTCGTSKGDLVKRVDAVGNVACYGYDTLHRVVSVTYPSGSYASKTSNKYFVYDTATVNSVQMTNGKTRMVEAYTAATQNGTKTTDVGISYTVRGETSDVYESTPHSSGYYHVSEQYLPNGLMKTLALVGISALPTFTVTPDGEGRVSTISASSGQNPLASTVYNTAGAPTSLTYGSSDSDAFTFDPNTNRMTKYQFTVNGQSLTGTLTWNSNSTLQNLQITDALNSADTQTCAYQYDDLMRIQSANCGSVWSQTFSYDAFGNISKNGTASWSASYSSSTNHITNVGGFTPTYDQNGNLLTDPAHTYSWDSAGKPVTIDSVNMTYDALGRMVEQNRSGSYTQFVYGPHGGKFAIMSAQTLQKAMLPLPGGAVAVYGPSGLLYYGHSDHLGNIRLGSTSSRTMSFDVAYAPFGETYAPSGSTDPAFTGQRQDTVTGLFDFPNREFSNSPGRWPSPDPSGLGAFHLADPQTLNRYAYVRNTPTSMIDPFGLDGGDLSGASGAMDITNPNGGDSPCNEDDWSCLVGPVFGGDPGNVTCDNSGCSIMPGVGNGPSSGDPGNSGQDCTNSSCGSAAPSDQSTISNSNSNTVPHGNLTVNLNANNFTDPLNPTGFIDVESGAQITGTLTTSQQLAPGDATITVNVYDDKDSGNRAPGASLDVKISDVDTVTVKTGSTQSLPMTEIAVTILASQPNGDFGFSGSGRLAFTIKDSQGNQFKGYADVQVQSTGVGHSSNFSPAGQNTFTVP